MKKRIFKVLLYFVGRCSLPLPPFPSLPSPSPFLRGKLLPLSSVWAVSFSPCQAGRPTQTPPHTICLGLIERNPTKWLLNSWCCRSAAWDQGQGAGAALQHLPSGSPQRWQRWHAGGALRPVPWVAHAALALLREGQDMLRAEDTHMSIAANKVKANNLAPFSMEKCSVRPSWSSGDISKSSKLREARGKYPPSPASTPRC